MRCGTCHARHFPLSSCISNGIYASSQVDASGYALVESKLVSQEDTKFFQGANTRMIRYNLPADQMHAPVQGPTHPSGRKADGGLSNHRTGHVEDSHLSSYAFDEQYNSFHRSGCQGVGVAVVRKLEGAWMPGCLKCWQACVTFCGVWQRTCSLPSLWVRHRLHGIRSEEWLCWRHSHIFSY